MLKVDKRSDCTIFAGSFFDDIEQYELNEINGLLSLKFLKSNQNMPVNFNFTGLINVIQSSFALSSSAASLNDTWIPIFIDNDNNVVSKEIRRNFSIKKKILGIENMVQFRGLFKNWTISNNNIKLNSNWFLNSNDASHVVDYGILCWYKNNTVYNTNYKKLKDLPVGSRIFCNMFLTSRISESESVSISPSDLLVKKSSNSLVLVNKDDSRFISTTNANNRSANIQFNYEKKIFDLSKVENIAALNPMFKLDIEEGIDSSSPILQKASLWIPNGEAYSYSLNNNRRSENYSLGIPSLSYLSPGLFPIYNAIYHRLTCRLVRGATTPQLTYAQLSILKKLSYLLSTAPLIDRTTIDLLYHTEITSLVDTLLNTRISDQVSEKRILMQTMLGIMRKFEIMSIKLRSYSTLGTNIINNKSDLFIKLTNKYTPHLLINQITNISYNHNINYGPNISIRRNIRSVCPKQLVNEDTANGNGLWTNTVYNNEIIKCHGIEISTNFGPNNSEIVLSDNNKLPTADITRSPREGDSKLDLGPPIKISLDRAQSGFFVDFGYNGNDNIRETAFWELINGPDCLRFSNCTAGRDNNIFGRCAYQSKYRTSLDESPKIYISSVGSYTIKANINFGFDKATDTLQIYVVDNNGQYGPGLTPPANVLPAKDEGVTSPVNYFATISTDPPGNFSSNLVRTDYLKCLCLNMSQFAISKTNGIFWPLRTDSYIIQAGFDTVLGGTIEYNVPGMVRLEEFSYSDIKTNGPDTKLTFTIKPETSSVLWDNIYIEHMRSEHPECSQCESFYQDLLGRTPKRSTQRSFGTSGFDRRRKYPDGAALKRFKASDETISGSPRGEVEFYDNSFLPVSLKHAPKILSYGGYSQDILNNIGISQIPGHPVVGANLPVLPRRHFFGYPENINCHLKPLNIGSGADISFDKGTFHPSLGWICSPSSSDRRLQSFSNSSTYTNDIINKDSSFKFKTDKLETFVFKGLGLYDLRPSIKTNNNGVPEISPVIQKSFIEIKSARENPNFESAKLNEHDMNYGYRSINGPGASEPEDEYLIESNSYDQTQFSCNYIDNGLSYSIDRADIDNLTINSIEIKINNINYPNPKHIVAWLEVSNNSMPTTSSSLETNYFGSNTASANAELRNYLDALSLMNSDPSATTKKIYLLNRDSLDNYTYNFSIKFSDNTTNVVGFNYSNIPLPHENDYSESIFYEKPGVIFDNQTIKPTLTANNYNDIDSTKFKEAIVTNKLYDSNNTFSKFKGIPLKNTKFVLCFGIFDDSDKLYIMDNTTLNNVLLGASSFDSRPKPNILTNAFCSWELVIHTNQVEQPVPVDPIGLFDRKSSNPIFDRCNFIANFKDKKYLIPQVNLNAPYSYLDDVNFCKYDDVELTTFIRTNPVEFPSWAILQIISAMTPFYAGGGFVFTGDPSSGYNALYQYFGDIRMENQTEIQRSKTQTGRYTNFGFGKSDKALINISNDGAIWYKLEVPIYKYSNSTILKKNKYQYIKISKNNMPFLGRFEYSKFSEGDIKLLPKAQQLQDSTYKNYFWRKNNIASLIPYPTQEYVNSNKNKILKIDGERAYYLFDNNEAVFISNPTDTDPNAGELRTIVGKGLVNIEDVNYTVLYLDQNINVSTFIAKNNNDTIVIFKADHSTVGEDNPFHKWGLEKSAKPPITPERHFNTLGEGSYGRGTEYIRENVFTSLVDENKIEPIYNLLNNKVNPLYKFNKLTIFSNGSTQEIIPTQNNPLRGYPWSLNNNEKRFLKNYIVKGEVTESLKIRLENLEEQKNTIRENVSLSDEQKIQQLKAIDRRIPMPEVKQMFIHDIRAYASFIEPDLPDCLINNSCLANEVDKLLKQREKELSVFFESTHEYTFMDIRCSLLASDDVPSTGEVIIENDWIIDQPKNKFSQADINNMINRVNFLSTETLAFQNQVETAKRSVDFPRNIPIATLKSLSIPDLIFYLNSISDPDSSRVCFSQSTYNDDVCRQAFTKRLIDERQEEIGDLRNAILTNNNYVAGVLPLVERVLRFEAYGVISIREELNNDYYWITIDPEQECSLSYNMTAKVLSKIKYHCIANKANVNGVQLFTPDVEQLCPTGRVNINIDGPDIKVDKKPGELDITISEANKNAEKSRFPSVRGWKTLVYGSSNVESTDKYIWINGGAAGDSYGWLDSLIGIREEYEIPTNAQLGKQKVKDVIDIKNTNTLKIRFGNMPRKVKEYDKSYTRYVPNFWNKLGRGFPSFGVGGPPWVSFDCWVCFDSQGRYINLPDQYKVMNEMLFRSYFGSVDGIEHKNSLLSDTKQSWEWIPYEYDKSPEAKTDY